MDPALPDLHLEISSKCALACPACPRTYLKGSYKVTDLPLQVVENIARSKQRYKVVTLCGGHGDPIYHSQFHEVISILKTLPGEPRIMISTNGSHRSESWWEATANLLRKRDDVIFGVDGLSDTCSVYRRNSNWDSIITAMKTLKRSGVCRIQWQWILFRFNEHQLEKAAHLARELDIYRFLIIGSNRHDEVDPWKPHLSLDEARERFKRAYDLPAL